MAEALYRWPEAAHWGRRVAKEKIYQHGRVTAEVRERFIAEVDRVTWAYKLATSTINLPGNAEVPEIQVFQVSARADDVSDAVLATIDRAVQYPVVFEVERGEGAAAEVRAVLAQKHLGAGSPKLSSYFSTEWVRADRVRQPMPTAISLAALHAEILKPLIDLQHAPSESVGDAILRWQAVQGLERKVPALERKLRTEPQLNRQIELRRELKDLRAELERLK